MKLCGVGDEGGGPQVVFNKDKVKMSSQNKRH